MLTKNGKILLKNIFRNYVRKTFGAYRTNQDISHITLKKYDGTVISITDGSLYDDYIFPQRSNVSIFSVGVGNQNAGVGLGSGTEPPTEDDYALSNPISYLLGNQYINTLYGYCYDDEEGNMYCDIYFDYYNNHSSQQVTISEFGIFSGSNNSTQGGKIMIYRDVLDTPITISPGETKTIKLTVKADW